MSADFDPYHRWLGIHPKHLPADHYRPLAIELLEADPEVIRDAAERQSGHVRRYALGQHGPLCQRILNEIGAAKACLLDPVKKAEYDATLQRPTADARSRLASATVTSVVASSTTPAEPIELAPIPLVPRNPVRGFPPSVGSKRVKNTTGVLQRRDGETRSVLERLTPEWLEQNLAAWARDDRLWLLPVLRSLALGIPAALLIVVLAAVLAGITAEPEKPDSRLIDFAELPKEPEILPATQQPPPGSPARPPGLAKIADQTVDEGVELRVSMTADAGEPPQSLGFRLSPGAPDGAQIDENTGEFTWTPTEAQGPGDYMIPVQLARPEAGNRRITQTLRVHVREVNTAPKFGPIAEQRDAKAGTEVAFDITATDSDVPRNTLSFSLLNTPLGAKMDALSGRFTWVPERYAAGQDWPITIVVGDQGTPPLRAEGRFTICVVALPRSDPDPPPLPPPSPAGIPPKPRPLALQAVEEWVVRTAEQGGHSWEFMVSATEVAGWEKSGGLGRYRRGLSAFGNNQISGVPCRTSWTTRHIYLRTTFSLPSLAGAKVVVRQIHDDDAWICVNGRPLQFLWGYSPRYNEFALTPAREKGTFYFSEPLSLWTEVEFPFRFRCPRFIQAADTN